MSGCLDTTVGACLQCAATNTSHCTKCGTAYNLVDGTCVARPINTGTTTGSIAMVQATYVALAAIVMIVMAVLQR